MDARKEICKLTRVLYLVLVFDKIRRTKTLFLLRYSLSRSA